MKKYLGILGAMALGAIIMFGFTHSEVWADSQEWSCDEKFQKFPYPGMLWLTCERGDLECIVIYRKVGRTGGTGFSCVKSGLF